MAYQFGNRHTVKEIDALRRFLVDLDELNLTELHAALGDTGVQIVEERFDKFVDPDNKRWKPLKREYLREGVRRDVRSPLKFRDLYKSFSYDASAKQVLIGTPKDYAKFHTDAPKNNGRPRRVIPLREFMGYTSSRDEKRLTDTVFDFVDAKTERGA